MPTPRSSQPEARGDVREDVPTLDADGPRKILFVDDEVLVLDGLRRALRSKHQDWDMYFATSVAEAIERLEVGDIDAVVSDVGMPGRDGFDLLAAIRGSESLADVPVVILTGSGEEGIKRKALDCGATDLLAKPVVKADLIARIGSVLRLKECQDRIRQQNRWLEERVRERTKDLERARVELIWRLGRAGEFRDSDTGYHVMRVGYFAKQIAEELALDQETVRSLFLTSPLHDIGKIGVPDAILLKPGPLSEEEWELMRMHTIFGASILREDLVAELRYPAQADGPWGLEGDAGSNPIMHMAADIAEFHHERWDGEGYPHGLAGTDIPLAARITAVADVFDALSSTRPYKPPLPEARVLEIMHSGGGTQFDSEVLLAFTRSIDVFREIREVFADDRSKSPKGAGLSFPTRLPRAS